jgi:hypothetical protein
VAQLKVAFEKGVAQWRNSGYNGGELEKSSVFFFSEGL